MKLTLEQITSGEAEVLIRYPEMNEQIQQILHVIEGKRDYIMAVRDGIRHKLWAKDILYCESVDRNTFLYTGESVYKTPHTLQQLETDWDFLGFFRCSKHMVLNINHMEELRSLSANRIDAKLSNGEHVIISRRYATQLRRKLRADRSMDE